MLDTDGAPSGLTGPNDVSAEIELTADLLEYARHIGIAPGEDGLFWLAREGFAAVVPPGWAEFQDDQGRIYFFNCVTESTSWSHPLDAAYMDLVKTMRPYLNEVEVAHGWEERQKVVDTHLRKIQQDAGRALEGWSGPYIAQRDDGSPVEYYHHQKLGKSSWESPQAEWEYVYMLSHSVLYRGLLGFGAEGSDDPAPEPPACAGEGAVLGFKLPLHLIRKGGDDDEQVPQSAASTFTTRSFHTARSSGREGDWDPPPPPPGNGTGGMVRRAPEAR